MYNVFASFLLLYAKPLSYVPLCKNVGSFVNRSLDQDILVSFNSLPNDKILD